LKILDVPMENRDPLERLLEESFEGWYLRHSKRTLREIEVTKAAFVRDEPVGLVMLKTLYDVVGYVYYIAVAKEFRRRKAGSMLLDASLQYFEGLGMKESYASIEGDNQESAGLFLSKGFHRTSYVEVSRKYGPLRALVMYRKMLVVPGEILLCHSLGGR
jgi:ribosomal protein S18 acetylase RimI-like enzyme